MPITGMFFNEESGRDIHVLRTQTSRSLTAVGNIVLVDADESTHFAAAYLPLHPEVELHFRPVFEATLSGTLYAGFGINVNRLTGEVSSPGPFSTDTPGNFLVECLVTRNDGGAEPIPTLVIRVHVHGSVKRILVTPPSLTIRRLTAAGADDTECRFSVRAEFDDDVIGDVTAGHGITWSPPQHFDAAGFIRIPAGVPPSTAPIAVTASASAAWAAAPVNVSLVVAQPWQTDSALTNVELVEGARSTWGVTPDPSNVPNVLILGQGFTGPDLPLFEGMVTGLVNAQKGDPITLPYDRLGGSMNYWRVAVPAGTRGVPIRCEVYLEEVFDPSPGFLVTLPFALPAPKLRAGTEPWTPEHLIYAAGLPMPADGVGKRSFTQIRDRWKILFPVAARPEVDSIPNEVIRSWQDFATRTFFEEFETFPPLVRGSPPTASSRDPHTHVDPDPDRGGQAEVDRFLAALQAAIPVTLPGGSRLGTLWSQDGSGIRFNNRKLLVYITNAHGRAHGGDFVSLPLHKRQSVSLFVNVPGSRLLEVDSARLNPFAKTDPDVFRTLAHELGHQFGLGDEYVEHPRVFTLAEANLADFANLTSAERVRAGGGKFDSANIKWNWERIRKAAVINGPIASLGSGAYRVPVRDTQALAFKEKETVRIRLRVPGKALQHSPPTWGDFTVKSIGAAGADLTIVESAPNTIALPGAESIIYAPVPAPASVGYPYARMLSPLVERYINTNNRPLTPRDCTAKDEAARGGALQIPEEWPLLISTTDLLWSRRNVPLIVGLYVGGAKLACGIFHPAGRCMMRNSQPTTDFQAFCPVCRYVLVDFIDPSHHGSIDALYDETYQS